MGSANSGQALRLGPPWSPQSLSSSLATSPSTSLSLCTTERGLFFRAIMPDFSSLHLSFCSAKGRQTRDRAGEACREHFPRVAPPMIVPVLHNRQHSRPSLHVGAFLRRLKGMTGFDRGLKLSATRDIHVTQQIPRVAPPMIGPVLHNRQHNRPLWGPVWSPAAEGRLRIEGARFWRVGEGT